MAARYFLFQWRPTVLSKVVPLGTCFFIEYDISFHRKHSKLLNMENSNTPRLYRFSFSCYSHQSISDYSWEVYIVHSGVFAG